MYALTCCSRARSCAPWSEGTRTRSRWSQSWLACSWKLVRPSFRNSSNCARGVQM